MFTMLDLQQKLGSPIDKQVVDDLKTATPLFTKLPSAAIAGTQYQYRRLKSVPKIGPRPLNAGITANKSRYEVKNDQCKLYQGLISIDKALALADPEGREALMMDEAKNHMRGVMFGMEQAAIYGTAMGEYGMPGLYDAVGDHMCLSAVPANNTAGHKLTGGTSVLAVVDDPSMLRLIWGNNKVISFDKLKEQLLPAKTASGADGMMPAYTMDVTFWVGLSVRSEFAVARLGEIDEANPLTDAMLAELLNLFPSGIKPTRFIMNPRARYLLQKSRATSLVYQKKTSGQTPYAELPTEYEGIPIEVTDAILNDETAANIAAAAASNELTVDDLKKK